MKKWSKCIRHKTKERQNYRLKTQRLSILQSEFGVWHIYFLIGYHHLHSMEVLILQQGSQIGIHGKVLSSEDINCFFLWLIKLWIKIVKDDSPVSNHSIIWNIIIASKLECRVLKINSLPSPKVTIVSISGVKFNHWVPIVSTWDLV